MREIKREITRSRVNSRKKVNLSRKRNETYELRIIFEATQAYSERNVSLVQMLTLLYSSADLCAMGLTLM